VLGVDGVVERNVHGLDVVNDLLGFRGRFGQDRAQDVGFAGHLHEVKLGILIGTEVDLGAS
jgi:hypothetical protein